MAANSLHHIKYSNSIFNLTLPLPLLSSNMSLITRNTKVGELTLHVLGSEIDGLERRM